MKTGLSMKKAIWMAVFLMMLGWSGKASARDCYLVDTWRYSVNLEGTNQLRLKMPLYDKDDYDCWIVEGTVYIQIEGGDKETLFYYESEKDISGGDYRPYVWHRRGVDGTMTMYRNRGYSAVSVNTSTGKDLCPCVENQDYATFELLWDIPYKYRGKKVTISWSIHHNGNSAFESNEWISISPSTMTIPSAPELQKPMAMDPIISYDAGHPNQMMVPYMIAASNIQSMKAYYKEVYWGKTEVSKTVTLSTNTSDFVYLPAEVCVRDFYIESTYVDSEKKTQTTQSAKIDLPILHQPKRLSATVQPSGKVLVSWGINNSQWGEISATDTWEIQRNVTGDPTNNQWMSLGQVNYDKKSTEYSFPDETLLSAYQGKDVYYRVRRVITAVWDWSQQSGYAMVKLSGTLALPTISNASVGRSGTWDDASHPVTLDFSLGAPPQKYDKDGRFVLHNREEWEEFAALVNGGKNDLNAVMANDIDLGDSQVRVGVDQNMPYSGSFDGNGHTLNINYTVDFASPFRIVKDVTIKNLHITGNITNASGSNSGFVGLVLGAVTLQNCRSSVIIKTSAEGQTVIAGFTGLSLSSMPITLQNCLFDGSIIGEKSYSNCGLVTYAYRNKLNMEHCLFAPKEIRTASESCYTFCGAYEGVSSSNYYTQVYGTAQGTSAIGMMPEELAKALGDQWKVDGTDVVPIMSGGAIAYNKVEHEYDAQNRLVLRDSTDWNTFIQLVAESKGKSKVDAVMAADFTIKLPVGQDQYQGTFEGNGHTLTVDMDQEESNELTYYDSWAPFRFVTGYTTIRNLHVVGTVVGGLHSAGLVGGIGKYVTNLKIENCHVSTNVKGAGNSNNQSHLGGIVGHGGDATIDVENCLFDGTLTAINIPQRDNMNNTYAGAFVGWQNSGAVTDVRNCLEQGSYTNIAHAGANYKYTGSPQCFGGTNNYNSNNWGECNKADGKPADELAAALGNSNWQVLGSNAVPIMTISDEAAHKNLIWDNRAKVVLSVEKTVDDEVRYTERREISNDERNAGKVYLNLTTACVDHNFVMTVERGESTLPLSFEAGFTAVKAETGEQAIYKFDNNVVIGDITADTLQNAVSLKWECKRGSADYYRILRYDKLTPDEIKVLEDNYNQTAYVDRNVRPQHSYIYIIEGVTQCEGDNVSRGQKEGACRATGMVRGYVRLANGIGMPGYTVTAEPVGNISNAEVLSCETDSTGFFEIGGLVYQKSGTYSLSVTDPTHTASFDSQLISFDEDINLQTNIIFTQTNYYIFSGYVLYDGSSIPVSGVRFLRDGVPVMNSNGKPVTTNNQGAFEVSVPEGSHQIQVVKDGHVFKNQGFYITPDAKPDSTWHNWKKNVSEIYLWDETKVNLQGRVVGGNIQGQLPLGESLSKNNLGDDITMVFQLEGDNTSWIVRDQLNASVTERHEKYAHGRNDTTTVEAYRHRIVIHPDPKTGEYMVPFYPVKFKVTEIYAKGYPTLFQTGMVSETVDLNDYADGDTATYSRIFHNQPTLDIWQFNGTQDRYYGLKQYTSMDNAGVRDTVYLWKDGKYSLGYPVFMGGAPVPFLLSAREEYRKNNEQLGELDVVQLDGGKVYISNGLVGTAVTDSLELDSLGQGTYLFTPQNTTFTLEGDMALRKMDFTLLYDGSYYDIEPVEGYVMAALTQPQGRRIIAGQNTHLVDILRDPPGSNSSAYIEAGSKFSYSYSCDYTVQMGVNIGIGIGSGSDYYVGLWGGAGSGSTAGTIHSSDNHASLSYDLATSYYNDWSYEYEFETTDRISTSDSEREIGANSDLYIGMTDNVIVEDAIAVRVVNSSALGRLKPGMGGEVEVNGHKFDVMGTAKILASGWDAENKDSIYLIRDEVLQVQSKLNSTFIHSQAYLLDELIPGLIRVRNALLLDSLTTADYAQALANNKKLPVYVSKVGTDNPKFGYSYQSYYPAGMTNQWSDSIQALNTQIQTWTGFIAANEKEKLEASELVKVYDFDGASSIDHSESFCTTTGQHRYWSLPSSVSLTGEDGLGADNKDGKERNSSGPHEVVYRVGGTFFSIKLTPLFGFDFNYLNGVDSTYNKEAGFTLDCSRKSNLTVAVYRTPEVSADSLEKLYKVGDMGVYYRKVEEHLKEIYNGHKGSSNTTSYIEALKSVPRYRNFVYRTLGGATASPWEDERRTIFYNPGMVLDQKTVQINKLRIWAKEASVSNVPYGEPARFTIYMTNESELPLRVKNELKYYLEDESNSKGAKVLIDGCPLTGSGIDLWLEPNTIIEKQVEVYAGAEYDYEDIAISFMDEEDIQHIETVTISAHFVPAAGKINISKPGDKWVVNTESAYDDERQAYYLPVHIDGFDVNFRNFDHIEFQYKLSNQGDKDWVNICSYYRNDDEGKALMELASGERKLMEHDGYIDAAFYGEKDPIEQYYDLRAVTFCRHGNGYLTNSSNILKGIKDTRRPQIFGTPQPVDGVLGIGDDIMLRFSEPIAGNYLSPVNNFEVIGQTNSSNVSLSTSLRFNGSSFAISNASRNLEGKSFTVDVMLNPADNGKAMTVFSHGEDNQRLELGLTSDHRMTAALQFNDTLPAFVYVAKEPCQFDGLEEVFYVFDTDLERGRTYIRFYDGTAKVGEFAYPHTYDGYGELILGASLYDSILKESVEYEGEMLEFRLWNRALTTSEMDNYRQKTLTGYELGLLDNYPLNEGEGNYSYNRMVGGSDLLLWGTTWKMPSGIGMKLDGQKGFRLNPRPFNRYAHQDYTLMFWFRTTDIDGTLLANGRAKDELDAKNHFSIGISNGVLDLRLGGFNVNSTKYVCNGQWHHVALTVNRSRNVGSLYLDKKLCNTFAVDTLGGISGNFLAAGATYVDGEIIENPITGNIDEIGMMELALSENGIKTFADNTPTGMEMGLLAYLSFSESQRQSDNDLRLMPSGVSLKRYKDKTAGEYTSQRDTIVSDEDMARCFDRTLYAPMRDNQQMENIKFSYVADTKDLLINLDVPANSIEKTNVYVIVKEVADLQGNLMASPAMMDLYVYRNPLRWSDKHLNLTTKYGEETTFTATIKNLSGKSLHYSLEGLPLWMSVSETSGTVGALDEETVTFTISPYTNIGNFEEVINLVGEDGMNEPLPVSLKVRGVKPDWAVDEALLHTNISMSLVGQVIINEEVAHDSEDMLAVFNDDHRLLGVAHLETGSTANVNEGLAFLNIYNSNYGASTLYFEFFDASSGIIYQMMPNDIITFKSDTIIGSSTNPVKFYTNNGVVQAVNLSKGWNWVSFNVEPIDTVVKEVLNNSTKWQVGDALEAERSDGTFSLLSYKSSRNPYNPSSYIYSWDCADSVVTIDPCKMYRFYSNNDKIAYIAGSICYNPIVVKKGWNRIGYVSNLNLPIGTALAEYADMGSVGDIIKSQSEFAVLTTDASNNRSWRGTLQFLRVGEGYMLKHNADNEVQFYYPTYFGASRYGGIGKQKTPHYVNTSSTSMTVIAVADGIEVQPGDRLTAYRGAEACGIAEADPQGLFFLSVGDKESSTTGLAFIIERDNEVIAVTGDSKLSYIPDAALGSLDEPTAISFLSTDQMDGNGWYSLSGIRYDKRPTKRGIYIHNNTKVTIK